MANIKSAKKRIKIAKVRTLRNKSVKSRIKTETKKFESLLENKELEKASVQLKKLVSYIDKAVTKGIFHKNTAARKKASFTKLYNKAKA